jgi:hypothetical protein
MALDAENARVERRVAALPLQQAQERSESWQAMSNKEMILAAEPKAILDHYESLRGTGKPCWYIRVGLQGEHLSDICATPREAWQNAADHFRASFRKEVA